MSYKKILKVFTIIYNGGQRVGFKADGVDKDLYLSPGNIRKYTNLEINEVEILKGSELKPVLYQEGENIYDGMNHEDELFRGDFPIIKNFQINCIDSIEQMRRNNSELLKNINEIKKVFSFNRNNKTIIGFNNGKEKAVFVPANRVTNMTKLDLSEIHILESPFRTDV